MPRARASDARIHDREEYSRRGKVAAGAGKLQSALEDVVRGHVVGHVDEDSVRTHTEHRALHRPRVVIARAEVAQERDDRRHTAKLT